MNMVNSINKMHQTVPVQVLPTPVKSPSDKKEYKVIRLENGLTACLISDPTAFNDEDKEIGKAQKRDSDYETDESGTDKSKGSDGDDDSVHDQKVYNEKMAAAALCVDVGKFSDPKDIPGMAHFLEHMVFMGSEKFPQEEDLNSFIVSRCGSRGAETKVETTIFYFHCFNMDLREGLDKLAQCFISPLMSPSSITKEREIVDSEFQTKRPDDMLRREQLLMSLAIKDSPVNAFTFGNSKTLRDNVKLSALHKALHEFRERHYSAHRMTLAIQAGLPIELLEAHVLDCFSDVPCNNLPPDDFSKYKDNVFDADKWNRIHFIESTKDVRKVEITFALPSLMNRYKSKSVCQLSMILDDEGTGSLTSYLRRKKNWVQSLITGNSGWGSEENNLYSFFTIDMDLTEKGLQNLCTIISTVFSFINMIKTVGPQERIYNEAKQIKDNLFRFATEQSVYDNVREIAEGMQIYPPEDYLTGPHLIDKYDPEEMKMILHQMVPRKANITVMTKTNLVFEELNQGDPIQYDKTEEWFGTRHTDLKIPEELLLRWESAPALDEFALPLPNQFLTENFDIVPSISDVQSEFPVKILENDKMELWHRKDETFKLPQAIWNIILKSPIVVKTAKDDKLMDFFIKLWKLQFSEDVWPAENAGLSCKVSVGDNGTIVIEVSGFNEKLPILIDLVVEHMKLFSSNLTEETFAAIKDCAVKSVQNSLLEPTTLAMDCSEMEPLEKQKVILDITTEDMKTFGEQLLKQHFYVRVLVQGNVSAEQASLVTKNIVRILDCLPITNVNDNPPSSTRRPLVTHKSSGTRPDDFLSLSVNSLNKNDLNSVVLNYYPGDKCNPKNSVILEVIVLLIEAPLYDTLRTEEQLGYVVDCYVSGSRIVVYVCFQADKYSTRHVDERIDLFMKQTLKFLKDIPESMFEETKRRLIKKKTCIHNSLEEEVSSNFYEIFNNEYLFDREKNEVELIKAEIKELTHGDLLDWWKKNVYCDEKDEFTCRKISRQVRGYGSQETSAEGPDDKVSSSLPLSTSFHSQGNASLDDTNNISQSNNAVPSSQEKVEEMDKANVWRRAIQVKSTVFGKFTVFFVNLLRIILSYPFSNLRI